jgi:competence protein ComEA
MHIVAALLRRKALVGAIGAIIAGAGLLAHSFLVAPQPTEPAAELAALELPAGDVFGALDAPTENMEATPAADVLVYVSGAVAAPDVYRLPAEARVKDLVLAAGGLAADADMERVNLAAPLSDGEHVTVPRIGAVTDEPAQASDDGATGGLLDINAASAEELDALPGIGPAIAARIVEQREANGPFKTVEDLQEVKGIGAALFAKIAPLVTAGS